MVVSMAGEGYTYIFGTVLGISKDGGGSRGLGGDAMDHERHCAWQWSRTVMMRRKSRAVEAVSIAGPLLCTIR